MATSAPSVAKHPVHLKFVSNLLNASHSRELLDSAREWDVWRIFRGGDCEWVNCQFCNTRVHHYLMLRNRVNTNVLLIGHDCYDKLRNLLSCGRVESPLPERRECERENRKHWNAAVKKFGGDRTFVGWFREQRDRGALPPDLGETVRLIDVLGLVPTHRETDALISYYKRERKFWLRVLIPRMDGFPHVRLLPKELSIDAAERLSALIERGVAAHRDRSIRRRRRVWFWIENGIFSAEEERMFFERQKRQQEYQSMIQQELEAAGRKRWDPFREKILRKCLNFKRSVTLTKAQAASVSHFENTLPRKPDSWNPDALLGEIRDLKQRWVELRDSILHADEIKAKRAQIEARRAAASRAYRHETVRAGAKGWHGQR